uniref:Uncharacterized protein n=1 Tax=Arundo donax TaxID=35708 RepID=A0A0A9FX72_ARUDO
MTLNQPTRPCPQEAAPLMEFISTSIARDLKTNMHLRKKQQKTGKKNAWQCHCAPLASSYFGEQKLQGHYVGIDRRQTGLQHAINSVSYRVHVGDCNSVK